MFSPLPKADDFNYDLLLGKLCISPLEPWTWALIPSAGLQNHAPQLCWVDNHTLACVWMAGDQEGTSAMSIMISFLTSEVNAWCKPQMISQDSHRSEQNPLLFVDGNQLHLIHTAQNSRNSTQLIQPGSSFSMQWTAKLRKQSLNIDTLKVADQSTWCRDSWTFASDLVEQSSFCRNPPYQRVDGSWLLPTYMSLEKGGAFGHDSSQVLILSPDSVEPQPDPPFFDIPQSKGRVHGSIVLSENKLELIQFFRSRLADRIYCSKSDLDGINWTPPVATSLPNNNSSIQACRLKSGRLAMIYNRFGFDQDPLNPQYWGEANWPRTRWPLAVALSEDDGVTWPWIRDIDTGFGFCGTGNWFLNGQLAYPCLLEGQPGELHIAYSWAGRTAIRYICLEEHHIIGFIPE